MPTGAIRGNRVHKSHRLGLEIALWIDRPVCDSMYLALAAHGNCAMITADRRLFNAVNSSELSGHIAYLDESL